MSKQNRLITVTVGGRALGVFDDRTGGGTTAEISKRRSGGMGPMTQRRALPDYADVAVVRELQLERDLEQLRWVHTQVGRADMEVTDQYLDDDGNPFGKPVVFLGKLSGCTDPEAEANSSDDALFELTMQTRSRS